LPGLHYYSLQKGPAAQQLAAAVSARTDVVDLAPELSDFADTAAAIVRLDLVITVDTSVAHLAGAVAANVWTLIPRQPDFRWLLDRTDSPWYPTMRLLRQTQTGDWDEVLRRVAGELVRWRDSRG
jgi:ADP-heptose:LPS heptosyltransferase